MVTVRTARVTFITVVAMSLASILFPIHRFATSTFRRNSSFPIARSPCFTVGFAVPRTRNGLGNHLFYYAGAMYVAWLTGRKPLILTSSKETKLDKVFDLDIERFGRYNECAVTPFIHRYIYAFNNRIEALKDVAGNVSIRLVGSFCSWKYTQPIEEQLRRELRFRRELTAFAEEFLSSNVPRGWNVSTFVRVGVHVRRGDFLGGWAVGRGFTVASREYLNRSMTYFVQRYPRIQFIVASNDVAWCRNNIDSSSFDPERVNVTFCVRHSTGEDLAVLASCDHSIMTTGTYSWWSSWLTNGTTVYYSNFPRRGSWLWGMSRVADFYPPTWIGMT